MSRAKKDTKDKKRKQTQDADASASAEGVVRVRNVVMKSISFLDNLEQDTPDPADSNPSAPQPVASQQPKYRLSQLRRKHKLPGDRKVPRGMSDIKI